MTNENFGGLADARTIPVFIHSYVDDMGLSLGAFRVYGNLARRANKRGEDAYPSYNTIGEDCFRGTYPNAKTETLRRHAIRAVDELVSRGLVLKSKRVGPKGGMTSNMYTLVDLALLPSDTAQGGGSGTAQGVVAPHQGSGTAPKGTPYEVTPHELKEREGPKRVEVPPTLPEKNTTKLHAENSNNNSTKTAEEEKDREEVATDDFLTLPAIMARYNDIFPPTEQFTDEPYHADPMTVKSVQSWMTKHSANYVVVALERARKANAHRAISYPGKYLTKERTGVFADILSDMPFANYQYECIARGEPLPTLEQFRSVSPREVAIGDNSLPDVAIGTRNGYLGAQQGGSLPVADDDGGYELPY